MNTVTDERLTEMIESLAPSNTGGDMRLWNADNRLLAFKADTLAKALSELQARRHADALAIDTAPLVPPLPESSELPAWLQVNNLFTQHRLNPPPTRLRDELVTFMEWAWYGRHQFDNIAASSASAVQPATK